MDRDSWWRGVARACRLGWLLTFTAAYGLAQWADLTWASSAGGVPAVDLAAGIATGLLIRAESRILLALVVIQVALCASLDYLAGGNVVGLIWVVQQVAPPLSIALVMRAMSAGRITSPARLGLLVGAALTSTFVWSVGLALANAAAIGGGLPDGTWTAVWTSEMAGIVLVGPGLLAVTRSARWPLGRILEACVVAALTVSAALAFLATARDEVVLAWPAQGLLLPLFLWIALRFGLAAVSASVAMVEVAALTTMPHDVVSFAAGDSAGGSSVLPVVSATLVGVAVFAVALNEERRRLTSSRLLAARGVVDSLLANSDARMSVKQYGHEGAGVYTLANPRFAASLRHSVPFIVGRADGGTSWMLRPHNERNTRIGRFSPSRLLGSSSLGGRTCAAGAVVRSCW